MLGVRIFIENQLYFIPATHIGDLISDYGILKYKDKPFSGIILSGSSFYYVANGIRSTKSDFCKEIFGRSDINLPTQNNTVSSLKLERDTVFTDYGLTKEMLDEIIKRTRSIKWG